MSENPYQTPTSNLDVTDDVTQFYVVSIKKFAILFFSTLGLYVVYWFYRNWREYKAATGSSVWPVPRAIFNIFFTHSLFREVAASLASQKISFEWSPNSLAFSYVVVALISNVLDRMAMKDIGSPFTDITALLLLPILFLTLIRPQRAINVSQNDAEGVRNDALTGANYAWIIGGLFLWALTFLGLAISLGVVGPTYG